MAEPCIKGIFPKRTIYLEGEKKLESKIAASNKRRGISRGVLEKVIFPFKIHFSTQSEAAKRVNSDNRKNLGIS